ncbi:hypothetical protein NPIL_81561 [Nephila pilipes]|uniref:Uncharacterized protein n=1 Tax=Nephila pilipes TaxID=299642 RepID=A0A8X6N3A7_NEPPI|nr:hypothetical protein NPIL_81561 [Nephila pilipes]
MSWYPRVATRTVLAPLADVNCLESNSFASLLPIAAQGLVPKNVEFHVIKFSALLAEFIVAPFACMLNIKAI